MSSFYNPDTSIFLTQDCGDWVWIENVRLYVFLMTCKAMHLRVTFSTSAHVDPKRKRLLTLCASRHKLIHLFTSFICLHISSNHALYIAVFL